MKIRNGFVSNSSSSSFVVRERQKKEAEEKGLRLIAVKDILALLKIIKDAEQKISEEEMDFIISHCGYSYTNDMIEDLEKIKDGYLSAPFDRDRAYESGIDYPVFEGDL